MFAAAYEGFTGTTTTTNAACTSTGSATTNFTQGLATYLQQCRNGGTYPEAVNNFFGQSMNIPSQFENVSAIYTDLNTTLANIVSNNGAISFVEKLDGALNIIDEKEKDLTTKHDELETNAERNERRFIEEKVSAGDEVEQSSNIRMLHDKVLAALYISYIFAAVVIVALISKNSQYNWRVMLVSFLVFLFITGVLFGTLKMFA